MSRERIPAHTLLRCDKCLKEVKVHESEYVLNWCEVRRHEGVRSPVMLDLCPTCAHEILDIEPIPMDAEIRRFLDEASRTRTRHPSTHTGKRQRWLQEQIAEMEIEKLRKLHKAACDHGNPLQGRYVDDLLDVLEDTLPALLDVAEAAGSYIAAVDAEEGQAIALSFLRTALARLGEGE